MLLSKGAENTSQGERQLLTIARAIASDPEIMILDERPVMWIRIRKS